MSSDKKNVTLLKLQPNHHCSQQTCQRQNDERQPIIIDQLYENVVGACGLWQWFTAILVMLSSPSTPTFPVFANSIPVQRCRLSPNIEDIVNRTNISLQQVGAIIGPWTSEIGSNYTQTNGCYQYKLDWTEKLFEEVIDTYLSGSTKSRYADYPLIPCQNGYVYELNKLQYPGSVVVEFNIVCEREWLVPLGSSMYFVGMMVGFLAGGWAGDHFGRKKSSIFLALIEFIFSLCVTFSPNYTVYILSRAIVAAANLGKVTVLNVMIMESTIAKYRSYVSAALVLGYNFLLRSLTSLEAYYIPDWRWLNLAVMAPNLMCVLHFWCLVESPRWLLSKDRRIDALKSLKFAYKINHFQSGIDRKSTSILDEMIQQEKEFQEEEERKNISSDMNNNPTKNQQSNQDYQDPNSNLTSKSSLQLFRSFLLPFSTKQLAKTTVFGILLFNGEVMTYFGLLLYARAVRGNVYLVSFINACTTIPALFMSTILYRVVRLRKPPLLFVFAVAFIILLSCGLYTYICNPENDLTLAIGSNLALVFLGAGLFMLYIYIPELYPSVMRSQGFGINAGLGRIGSILCTFVNQMDFYVGHGSPLLIYSVVTLLQLFILCIIPDTSGENLPDVLAKKQSDTEDANDLTSSVFSVSEFARV